MKVAVVGNGPAGSTTVITLKRLRPEIKIDYYMRTKLPRAICGGGIGFYAINKVKNLRAGDEYIGKEIVDLMYLSAKSVIDKVIITGVYRQEEVYVILNNSVLKLDDHLGIVMNRKLFDSLLLAKAEKLADNIIIKNVIPKSIAKMYDIVVDARGMDGSLDYYNVDELEYVNQWYIYPNEYYKDTIEIIFDKNIINHGYVWIFGYGDKIKVGYGELGKDRGLKIKPKVYRKYIYENLIREGGKIIHEEAMYLPLLGRIRLYDKPNIFRVGTSAGLIDPLTGAGIRYAIESGFKLAKSIAIANKPNIFTIKSIYRLEIAKIMWQLRFLNYIRKKIVNIDGNQLINKLKELEGYKPKSTNIFIEGLKLYIKLFLLH